MAETQRQPVPRDDNGELDTATAFLTFARNCVLKKTDGLTEEHLRRVLVGSGTTLLGLVHHLTFAERTSSPGTARRSRKATRRSGPRGIRAGRSRWRSTARSTRCGGC